MEDDFGKIIKKNFGIYPVSEIAATPTPTTIMIKIYNLLISICILFLTQSCSRSSPRSLVTINDGGLLTQKPCGPPCFWGIIPGESTEIDVIQVLKNKNIYDKCHSYNNEIESGSRGISCDHDLFISYQYGKNIVEGIVFTPTDLTIDKVITTLGDPDGVLVLMGGTSQEHKPFINMIVFYDQIQTRIILKEQIGSTYTVKPSVLLTYVSYFDRSSYNQLRSDANQKWEGYRTYIPSIKW